MGMDHGLEPSDGQRDMDERHAQRHPPREAATRSPDGRARGGTGAAPGMQRLDPAQAPAEFGKFGVGQGTLRALRPPPRAPDATGLRQKAGACPGFTASAPGQRALPPRLSPV
jgi:hypothetical protein